MRVVVVSDRRICTETLMQAAAAMPGVTVVGAVMQLSDAIRYCETDQADAVMADGAALRPVPSPSLAALGLPADPVGHPILADALNRSQNAYADLVPRVEQLSQRELQVFSLLGMGLSNRCISAVLAIGERTVKTFVGHILAKLGLESRLQAGLAAAALVDREHGAPVQLGPASTRAVRPGLS
jgi:DNA-binding NarL/FixJ family response regulator